jgi:xylulokinase
MDILIGIDLGSTSLKAVAYDPDGRAVAHASRPTELVRSDPAHPDWAIWRPEQIWGGTAEALKEAVAKLPPGAAVRGVAVTGMGMDAVPIDREGRWLYPFISWHCPRTLPQQRWWLERVGAERQFAVSGNIIWGFNTAFRILWIREHEPEVHRKTDRWLLIEDFVNFMLCGERATDYTMASSTLLFDQTRRGWSDELLAVAGIDRALLCDPRPSGTVLGTVHRRAAEATGLPAGTPVVLGGHDFLCGALPVGAHRPGVVLDVVGTWEIVMAPLARPVLTPAARDMGWWIDSHVARDGYAAVGCAVAADMLEWFRKQFGAEEARQAKERGGVDWDLLMAQAEAAPPGAGGVMFLPHLSGSTFPVVDPQSMGAFVGLRNVASKGHLLRAVVEGLGYQFLQIVEGLRTALGVSPDRFVAVGGGTQNAFWTQTKADMVGRPIETPAIEEATPLGAAILAGIGVGIYRDVEEAYTRVYRPGRTFEPRPGLAAAYAERFQAYRDLYPALKGLHERLRKAETSGG